MKKIILLGIIFSLSKIGFSFNFSDYPAEIMSSPSVTEIDFKGFDSLKRFSKNLNNQINNGPNYAGHYHIAFLGCGSACQGNIIIDLENGKIIDRITSCDGMKFKLDSRLFISNPISENANTQTCPTQHFLLLEQTIKALD